MKTFTAARAKTHFGEFLDASQREPVLVTKNNRPIGIMMSYAELEDTVWGERAKKAMAEGFAGVEESKKLMEKLLNAKA
jgi:prevent-host-death family protein